MTKIVPDINAGIIFLAISVCVQDGSMLKNVGELVD